MPKFGMLRTLLERDLRDQIHIVEADEANEEQLKLVHDADYVRAFMDGCLDVDAVRRIGLPWSRALVRRTLLEVGGTIMAMRTAIERGIACNAAGGTHHAHRTFGSGFCIFNDLAVAARVALTEGLVERILIIDLDVHQGDGSAAIFADEPRVFTFSMHAASNFPARKQPSDHDVPLPNGVGDEAYLATLERELVPLLDGFDPDLVLYDAGVDPHVDDALGRLSLSSDGLMLRDGVVLRACMQREIPAATVIGGGYSHDLEELTQRHSIVFRVASYMPTAM